MENFVNRDTELRRIEETFVALIDRKSVVRTPIIEFHGVGGIGKTTILKKVEQYCNDRCLPYIWADASKSLSLFLYGIINQVKKYKVQVVYRNDEQDLLYQSISATKILLAQGPVVILLDSLDAANREQLSWIEAMLRDLIDDNKLFVVLASKKMIPFDSTRSIARKLVTLQLQPFDRHSCKSYLEKIIDTIEPEIRDMIFEWTQGYPLAVNVMVQEIRDENLNLSQEQDRRRLLSIMTDRVIKRGVFSDVVQPPSDIDWYQTILSLLSVARRSIIPIMRKLIETFTPQYALSSNLAYMMLPKKVNQATEVLNWDSSKAGFVVEKSIRHIFMIKLKIEQPELYYNIHDFLAQLNKRQAEEVSGWDRNRYLQEYLYHSANCKDTSKLPHILEKTVLQIITESKESPEIFSQFYEEYICDEELKTALGVYADIALSLIYKELARLNRWLAAEASGFDRIFYLKDFFYYVICDPLVADLPSILIQHVQQIVKEISEDISLKLYKELLGSEDIKRVLGKEIVLFKLLVKNTILPEEKV